MNYEWYKRPIRSEDRIAHGSSISSYRVKRRYLDPLEKYKYACYSFDLLIQWLQFWQQELVQENVLSEDHISLTNDINHFIHKNDKLYLIQNMGYDFIDTQKFEQFVEVNNAKGSYKKMYNMFDIPVLKAWAKYNNIAISNSITEKEDIIQKIREQLQTDPVIHSRFFNWYDAQERFMYNSTTSSQKRVEKIRYLHDKNANKAKLIEWLHFIDKMKRYDKTISREGIISILTDKFPLYTHNMFVERNKKRAQTAKFLNTYTSTVLLKFVTAVMGRRPSLLNYNKKQLIKYIVENPLTFPIDKFQEFVQFHGMKQLLEPKFVRARTVKSKHASTHSPPQQARSQATRAVPIYYKVEAQLLLDSIYSHILILNINSCTRCIR